MIKQIEQIILLEDYKNEDNSLQFEKTTTNLGMTEEHEINFSKTEEHQMQ